MNIKKQRLMGVLLISIFLLTLTVPRARAIEYPPIPQLLVTLDRGPSDTIIADVTLMGEGGVDLDPFWDIQGFDITMNFQGLEALSATIDPDNWFKGFWPLALQKRVIINNTEGWVWIYGVGTPFPGGIHIPPYGQGRILSVTFAASSPPLPVEISLRNPRTFVHTANLDADAGLIDLTSPVGTQWTAINLADYETPFTVDDWVDVDTDSELSIGDDLIITNEDTGLWHTYEVHDVKGTLGPLNQKPFAATQDVWVWDCPTHKYSPWPKTADTGLYADGFGNPNWIGTYATDFPIKTVNSIEVYPQIGDPYYLTEGTDFTVNPDGTLELLTPLDEYVEMEFVGTMPDVDLGWPALWNLASGIESVWLEMPNGTNRYARNTGYARPPPSEWWFDFDFPYEIESWWASGYYPGPWVWPDGTDIYCTYWAPASIHIDYWAADPRPYYVEMDGTYAEFLTALSDPVGTKWDEINPGTFNSYTCLSYVDSDLSGDVTIDDDIVLYNEAADLTITFIVGGVSTDIIVDQVVAIDDVDPESPFYNMEPIVALASFPHPERDMSPWHNSESSSPIPHVIAGELFADFTVSNRYAKESQDIIFDASTSCDPEGAIVSYEWDFGDGTTATGLTAKHAYGLPGFYVATLTVTDNDANTDSASKIMAIGKMILWARPEHAVYDVSNDEDEYNDLTVRLANYGTESVEVTAMFTTYDRRTGMLLGLPLEVTGMATAGTEIELTVGWNPTDHGWEGVFAKYTVNVELTYEDVDGTMSAGEAKINFNVRP